MALPVILIDSATGTDTNASGAGPGTALTGSAGVTDGTGLVVTLDGNPDLSGVATDGSHVIYFADTTAGNRNFAKITAKDNSAKTVTVANAFGASLSNKWAIGGKRAKLGSTTSLKLIENNGSTGDALPGWTVEFQSGHAESTSTSWNVRVNGSTDHTQGPFIIRGAAGGTRPVLTWTADVVGLFIRGYLHQYRFLELKCTSGGGNTSAALSSGSAGGGLVFDDLKIGQGGSTWRDGISNVSGVSGWTVLGCEITSQRYGIVDTTGGTDKWHIISNYIHGCSNHGIWASSGDMYIQNNILSGNGGCGYQNDYDGGSPRTGWFVGNTVYNNTSDGANYSQTSDGIGSNVIMNNIFANNGGYGLKFSGSGVTLAYLTSEAVMVLNNDFYSNTSGTCNFSGLSLNEQTLDPQFTSAGGGNFTIGTNLKALGYSTGNIGTGSATRSYVDIGAAQRVEPAPGGPPSVMIVQGAPPSADW